MLHEIWKKTDDPLNLKVEMSHNHLMNTQQQQQQQHTMMNSSTTVAAATAVSTGSQPQRNILSQRGQVPHLQQQQQQPQQHQMMGSYHKQKQTSPEVSHQFTGVPIQNGGYQTVAGSSHHSNLSLDNGQINIHQYQSQALQQQTSQSTAPSHQYQTAVSQQQQQQQQQQYHQPFQHQQHHELLQQQQHMQIQQQKQMSPQQQTLNHHHQHLQIQQHLQQRSLNQQQRYQKQQPQPKQILQHAPVVVENTQAPSFHPQSQKATGSQQVTVTNGQIGTEEKTVETSDGLSELSNGEASQLQANSTSNASENQSLANTKEKTPMCLINELARFNKMSHQYTLVDEQGPAHKKTFYVKLKLGDEEYSASGESIKKAQHAAAAIALVDTKYQHPPPKPARYGGGSMETPEDENITPTVELNALAMKRGEAAVYKSIEPQQSPYYHQPSMDFRGLYNQRYHQYMCGGRDSRYRGNGVLWPLRYHYPRMNRAFYVALRVGHREFIGDGATRQAARHNAAQKALRILKNLPVQNEKKAQEQVEEENIDNLKSEISLVHEIALRHNMVVHFEVTRETGPPHMKNFITRCTVADMVTEGEGNSKKMSKKKAAELMREELKKLPAVPAPAFPRPKSKVQINKKKNRNLIKSEIQQQKADPNYGVGINPISRLIQIMQAQKKKEPMYTLVAERGLPRRREFIVQVEVEEKTCTGTGPNKKLAKRSAAESMLQLLGYTKPSPQPTKSSFKHSTAGEVNQTNGDKKVTFVEGDSQGDDAETKSRGSSTQQQVPGLLHLPTKSVTSTALSVNQHNQQSSPTPVKENSVNLASILKPSSRPEIQLRELCKAFNYQLEIDDFTKKRITGTEHITRITVGEENAQSFHGSNTTLESSRDMAALDALKVLVARVKDIHPGGDGPQMKKEILTRSSPAGKKDISK